MDAKKAITNLRVIKDFPSIGITDRTLTVAIKALEKQVPKEPVQKEDSSFGWAWYCPNCGSFIDPGTYKFCQECGQALKKAVKHNDQ